MGQFLWCRKEKTQIDDYTKNIKKRVENFFDDWLAIHWDKYKKNRLYESITNLKNIANLKIMKCYNVLFSKEGFITW